MELLENGRVLRLESETKLLQFRPLEIVTPEGTERGLWVTARAAEETPPEVFFLREEEMEALYDLLSRNQFWKTGDLVCKK